MAYSYNRYTGDGSTTQYAVNVSLGFLSRDDIHVYLDDVASTAFTWITDGLIEFTVAPANAVDVLIRRIVDKTALQHDYQDGAVVVEKNLDESNKQAIMIAHEVADGFLEIGFNSDMNINLNRIVNLGDPVDATDAANQRWVLGVVQAGVDIAADVATAQASADVATAQAGLAAASKAAAEGYSVATAADAVHTNLDTLSTAADVVLTAADVVQTGEDAVDTTLDRVQTGLDVVATAADRVQTGLDRIAAASSASDAAASAASIISLESSRNKLVNGGFDVNQREVTGTVVLSAGDYGHDRWKAGTSGCTYTFALVEGVTTLTITAGSLLQIVEGCNIRTGTYTLSNEGTATGTGDGSLIGGSNVTVEFGTGTLKNVQLEEGSAATEFEQRPLSVEQMLCYRYFYRETGRLLGFLSDSDSLTKQMLFFNPVEFRVIPTVDDSNATFSNCSSVTLGTLSSERCVRLQLEAPVLSAVTWAAGVVLDAEL